MKSAEQSKKPIILVDTSYTSFYRFFATIRWYSFAQPEEFAKLKSDISYDWKNNKTFIEKYEKMYLDSIIKLVKKKIFDNSNIIFCMDSPKENLWRMDIQSDYKGDRIDLSLKHNFKPTFEYTYTEMIPKFIKTLKNIYSMRIEKMEGDDLIAILANYIKEQDPNHPVYIVSGDEDFLQLGRPNVIFINYRAKKPFVLSEEQAALSLRNKFILGDTSDCIPSIFPKGPLKAKNKSGETITKKDILESDEKLFEYLEMNPDAKKQYDINKKMVDFRNIPKMYINKVIKMFDSFGNLLNEKFIIPENKTKKKSSKKELVL